MRRFFINAVVSVVSAISLPAQESVSGFVVDQDGFPLDFVNVVLVSQTDSTFVAGCVSGEDGSFSLQNETGKSVAVKLSSIGYETLAKDVPVDGLVGRVVMAPLSVTLGEVVVKSNLPKTAIKGGALVTNVENSVLSVAGTANDVLMQIPMVLGRDGNFEVFGKGTPLIYINGRLVRDNNDLAQLNSRDIKSIEVVTNPGAKYDASVKSVIRIRTRRPQGEGFSGNIRTQNGFAHYFRTFDQVDLKYRTDGLEIFTNVGYYGGKAFTSSTSDIITLSKDIWRQMYDEKGTNAYNELFGKIGFDYMINERHSVGAYYQNGVNKYTGWNHSESYVSSNGDFYDLYVNEANTESERVPKHFANVYYNGSVGRLGIDFNADFMSTRDRGNTYNDENSENFANEVVETRSRTKSRLFAEKFVLCHPLLKGGIEIGQEYTNSRFTSGFNTSASQLVDATTSSEENNAAVFVQLSQQFGILNIAAGLRYEHVNFDYYNNGRLVKEQGRTYDNLFPSLSISTMLRNVQLALSYNSKTERPRYAMLDGTVGYINRFTYKLGNPYLQPSTAHSVEMMAAWRWLFAQVSYIYAKDPIYNATQPYTEDEKVRLITYRNFDKNHFLNVFVGANLKWGIWQPRINAGIMKQWFDVPYGDGSKSLGRPIPFIQFQNAIHLPGDIWLNIDAQWRGRGENQNFSVRSATYVNAKLYKSFMNDRFSVTVEANDIFNKNFEQSTFYCGDMTVHSVSHDDTRNFFVTLQWRFNSSNDRYRGRGAGNSEKARF